MIRTLLTMDKVLDFLNPEVDESFMCPNELSLLETIPIHRIDIRLTIEIIYFQSSYCELKIQLVFVLQDFDLSMLN